MPRRQGVEGFCWGVASASTLGTSASGRRDPTARMQVPACLVQSTQACRSALNAASRTPLTGCEGGVSAPEAGCAGQNGRQRTAELVRKAHALKER